MDHHLCPLDAVLEPAFRIDWSYSLIHIFANILDEGGAKIAFKRDDELPWLLCLLLLDVDQLLHQAVLLQRLRLAVSCTVFTPDTDQVVIIHIIVEGGRIDLLLPERLTLYGEASRSCKASIGR